MTQEAPAKPEYKPIIKLLVRLIRKERLDYQSFSYCCRRARKHCKLYKPRVPHKIPQLLTDDELKRFYQVITASGNIQREIMLRLLLFTGVRVTELTSIKVTDVDPQACKIFIRQGKGSKDRVVLIPEGLCLTLRAYMQSNARNTYLFESRHHTQFSARRIQQIVKEYGAKAGIQKHIYPHLLRHQMITFLTGAGLTDSQIQLISGHSSKAGLGVYQHLSLGHVEEAYQAAARTLKV